MVEKVLKYSRSIQIFIFVIGILLWVYISDTGILSDTLISLEKIFLIVGIVALLSALGTWLLGKKLKQQGSFIAHILYGIVFTNSIFWIVFLKTNAQFHTAKRQLTLPILERGLQGSPKHKNRNKYAKVEIEGKEMEVSYAPDVDIDSLQKVQLTVAKGLWGYTVILNKNIAK